MDKVIKNGKVAVLYSPGYGAGWYTWNSHIVGSEKLVFDPVIVNAVLDKYKSTTWITDIYDRLDELFGSEVYVSKFGIDQLQVEWVAEGKSFVINEYDGSESIQYKDEYGWLTA